MNAEPIILLSPLILAARRREMCFFYPKHALVLPCFGFYIMAASTAFWTDSIVPQVAFIRFRPRQ